MQTKSKSIFTLATLDKVCRHHQWIQTFQTLFVSMEARVSLREQLPHRLKSEW